MKLLYNLYQMKRSWLNSKLDSCKLEFEDPSLNLKDTSRVKGSRKEQKQGLATAKYMQASFIKDIEDILNSEKENGLSYNEMKKVIADKLKNRGWLPNEKQVPSRVKLIINNTIAVNKARDEYNSQMLAKDYYPYLRWKQQDRAHPRDSHKVLDGKVFSKDDPSLLSIYPPKGFNCNCVLIDTTQKEVDKNGYKVTPVDDAIKELDDSSKDYGGINWKPDLSKFPKDMQAKLKEVFADGKEESQLISEFEFDNPKDYELFIANKNLDKKISNESQQKFNSFLDQKNKLDVVTLNALKSYEGAGYRNINDDLRKGKKNKIYDQILQGDLNFNVDDDINLFRGECHLNDTVTKIYDNYIKNSEFPQLTSTSFAEETASSFAGASYFDYDGIYFDISVKKGVKVGVGHQNEQELLFAKGTQFTINNIEKVTNRKGQDIYTKYFFNITIGQ